MEENIYTTYGASNDIPLNSESVNWLHSISKWTKFLSVLGFVMLGLILLGILGMGTLITSVNHYELSRGLYPYVPGMFSWLYAGIYILMLLVYAVPVYYLYKFSTKVKKALRTNSTTILSEAILFLQKHFMLVGMLVIIWLVLMVLTMIILAIGVSGMM